MSLPPDNDSDLFLEKKNDLLQRIALALGLAAVLFFIWFWVIRTTEEPSPTCATGYTEMYLIEYQAPSDREPLPMIEVSLRQDRYRFAVPVSFISQRDLLAIEKSFQTICVKPIQDGSNTALVDLPD